MDLLAPQGFYHADETKMVTPYRHFNTWMGDPVRVMLAANQNMMIERDGLLENVTKTGAVLQDGMPSLPPRSVPRHLGAPPSGCSAVCTNSLEAKTVVLYN